MNRTDEIMTQVEEYSSAQTSEEYYESKAKLHVMIDDAVKDSARYNWLINYFVSPDNHHDDSIVACNSPQEISAFIDKIILSEAQNCEVTKCTKK